MIKVNGKDYGHYNLDIQVTVRAKTVLLSAYQWAGHQCSAYEGSIADVRVVRRTVAECVAELRSRWLALAGQNKYVGFGGQFRHVDYYSPAEVNEAIDALEGALEEAIEEGVCLTPAQAV